ncbi:MAG: hypothetical protein MI919_41315 [Holophagales bacterium]|nr:hypothetical protein [Holophagales bacterium]
MTHRKPFVLVFALVLALCAPVWAAPSLDLAAGGGEMTWRVDHAYEKAYLRVTGPYDYVYDAVFGAGEIPSFSAGDLDDGRYGWSLLVVSGMNEDALGQLEAARAGGNVERALAQLRLSGAFSSHRLGGSFVKSGFAIQVPDASLKEEEAGITKAADDVEGRAETKDQVFNDDVIMTFSLCVGNDCVNGESFGFDTIRLKENNLRIHFQDTSTTASFPSNDWRIEINGSNNGDANYFAIQDATAGRIPFRVEAGAPIHALYVEADGDIGVKTKDPVVDIHVVEGNTPTLRLEQDGSDGFASQTWDLAGNEANFFLRDVTNGSELPFRVKPGADSNSVFIDEISRVGFGVGDNGPDQDWHMRSTDGDGQLLIEETNASAVQRVILDVKNSGRPTIQMHDTSNSNRWVFSITDANGFEISRAGSMAQEFVLDSSGNLTLNGTLTTGSNTLYPDYVFEEGYELMPLDQVESFIQANGHLPNVKSEEDVELGKRINMTDLSISLLEKVEELTLYTIDQHKTIGSQQSTIESQNEQIRKLEERLSALEASLQ